MAKLKAIRPPVAPKKATAFHHHNDLRVDNYFWLKNIKDPETKKYIKAENKYSEKMLEPLKKFKEKLFKELKSTINENETSAETPVDDWLYFSQVKKGLQYKSYYRKPKKGGRPELLLDCNKLAKGKKYFSLGVFEISPNHQWLAYAVDFSGNEKYTIHFKNLVTGKILKKKITEASDNLVWANDNQTVYYSELDDNHRPHKAFRYDITADQKGSLIYEEKDQKHFVGVSKTSDHQWILIETSGVVTSEVWFGSADNPEAKFSCIAARQENHEYSVNSRAGYFYIRSNENAINFKLMVAKIERYQKDEWIEFIPEDQSALFRGFFVFDNFLALNYFRNALPEVKIYNFEKEKYSSIRFKEKAFSLSFVGNEEFKSQKLRMVIESPVTPEEIIDYDMLTRRSKIVKAQRVKNFKSTQYKCERIMIPSHDGKKIPVTIFYKKGFKKNGKQPLMLFGYGSYGAIIQPNFIRRSLPLLNRGFAFAIAHIRGGQELGRSWYEDGKFLNKKNTFHDFISTTKWLIQKKWTSANKMAIMGGSAGGMLMGAVINMYPELFKVCVAHVPFVDVINTMLDDSLPLTKMEYKEWGDPNNKKFYEYMKSYSPYDNVKSQRYPHLLITGGLHDFRVTYWEPTKWAAKLRELKVGEEVLLLKIKTAAGHFGASGRFNYFKEEAEALAFIIKYLDLPLK